MFGTIRSGIVVPGLALMTAVPAAAHHGRSWADAEQSRLEGVIEDISMNLPHPSLRVRDAQGTVWFVELGNPGRTARSGFGTDTAQVGDGVTVIGNRDRDEIHTHIKAVRIVIDGRNYDMSPECLRANDGGWSLSPGSRGRDWRRRCGDRAPFICC